MKIFLSYSSKNKIIAEEVYYALVSNNEVFFDHTNIRGGDNFNEKIKNEVENSKLFIFLISPDSIAESSYALTELKFAREKWKNPAGYILPVMIRETKYDLIPPYLRAVNILEPEGNIPAEVAALVLTWKRPLPQKSLWGLALLVGVILIAIILGIIYLLSTSDAPDTNINTNSNFNGIETKKELFIITRGSYALFSSYDPKSNLVTLKIPINIENTSNEAETAHYMSGRLRSVSAVAESSLSGIAKESIYQGLNPELTEGKSGVGEKTNLIQPGRHEFTYSLQFLYDASLGQRMNTDFQQQFIIEFRDLHGKIYQHKIICFTGNNINAGVQPKKLAEVTECEE